MVTKTYLPSYLCDISDSSDSSDTSDTSDSNDSSDGSDSSTKKTFFHKKNFFTKIFFTHNKIVKKIAKKKNYK